jgi:hypothetical protein
MKRWVAAHISQMHIAISNVQPVWQGVECDRRWQWQLVHVRRGEATTGTGATQIDAEASAN